MKKFNLTIFLKKIKHLLRNIGSDADKDWRISLSLFILAVITSTIWHINVYITSLEKELSETTLSANEKGVNVETLAEMTAIYDRRAEEFQKLLEQKPISVDPAR